MGNCLRLASAAAAAETIVKPFTAAIDGGAPCDEQGTVDSSFATASSPPSSPAGKAANDVAMSQGKPADTQSNISPQNCNEDASVVEQHREEGQRRLRELVVTGAHDGAFDWASIIALAEDLHRKEQLLLRSYNADGEGSRKNASRRQAFFEKRRRAKERARRRKLESVGSFSVNLLAYESEGQSPRRDEGLPVEEKPTDEDHNDASSNVSIESEDNEALNESGESDEVDVFEDDRDDDTPALSPRISLERPGTPLPLVTPTPIIVNDGSFLAATSLFGSVEEEEEESSSEEEGDEMSSVASLGKADWDLMTIDEIDENATLGEF